MKLLQIPAVLYSRRTLLLAALMLAAASWSPAARADAVQALRDFVREVRSGEAAFAQTVTAADGRRQRNSSGSFEFERPNRFRFTYDKPFEQLIVADGQQVWIWDPDLNQASSRAYAQALGTTPAALLTGTNLDADFTLSKAADADGLQWALAVPKASDGGFQSMRVGFRGRELAAVEIVDSFGQRSLLRFSGFKPNATLPAERFRFTPPPGADVLKQ